MSKSKLSSKEKSENLRDTPIRAFTGDPLDIPCIETSDPERLCRHPVVSVHMITYNHEPYIRQAIEGVVMQKTQFPFELVIGEDASSDKTREICFDYQRKHPDEIRVLWWHENVSRLGGNSRRSMVRCRGKYIAFCEGDDYWTDPGKLQRQVDFLEKHPDYSAIAENGDILFMRDGTMRRFNDYDPEQDVTLEELIRRRHFPTAGVVCRREAVLGVFDPDAYRYHYDTMCWCHLTTQGKFRYSPVVSSVYRRGNQGITESTERVKWFELCENWSRELVRKFGGLYDVRISQRIIFGEYAGGLNCYSPYRAPGKYGHCLAKAFEYGGFRVVPKFLFSIFYCWNPLRHIVRDICRRGVRK